MDLSLSEQLLRVVFSTFCGQKNLIFFLKYSSVRTKKLHKKLWWNFFFEFFFWIFWGVKIGCHSCFNPECNTKKGFIDSLYIALEVEWCLIYCWKGSNAVMPLAVGQGGHFGPRHFTIFLSYIGKKDYQFNINWKSRWLLKGGPVEERLYKKTSQNNKFEFSLPKTDNSEDDK